MSARAHACGSNERRDEGRNAMTGGAAQMAQLLAEHNMENFGGGQTAGQTATATNPISDEKT